jgi:hypothetical protein
VGIAGLLLVLPFVSAGDYLRLLNNLRNVFGPESYNVVGLLTLSHSTSVHVAAAVANCIGIAVLALAYVRRSLALALVASLVLSPIVWTHYFVLLAVPLAIRWPRLSPAWFLPVAMVVCPGTGSQVRLWHVLVGLGVLVVVTVLVERAPGRPDTSPGRRRLETRGAPTG